MANSWFRMYGEFATDPKVQMLSETDQRRLTMIFCLRCNGHVTLQDEEVTFLLRISNDEWQVTKALFISKGFIDDDNEVLNWDKRQFISDSSAERVARHRAKSKEVVTPCNVTVTPPEQIQNRTDTEQIKKNIRGSRLPNDWVIPQEYIDFCQAERPDLNPKFVADSFKDYWIGVVGTKGVKGDWLATWRNWVRRQDGKSYSQGVTDAALTIFKPQYIAEQTGSFFANHNLIESEA